MPRDDPIFRRERIELDFKDVGLRGCVPQLGRLHTGEAHSWSLLVNENEGAHEGIIEVHYLAQGSQVWQVAGREYRTVGGDVFVALPGEQHEATADILERILIYWIRLRLPPKDKGGRFLNFPKKIVSPMIDKLSGIHPESRVFKASLQLRHLFDAVILADAHAKAEMKPLDVSLALLVLVSEIVRCIEAREAKERTGNIAAVQEYIDGHLQDGPDGAALLTNDALAREANLSRSQFQFKFRQQTGMSPSEYVQHRKIEQAVSLLRSGGHTVTGVAMLLGFASSQYFATVFKKYTNKRPRDYL
ncbi:MAG: hypothetical protein DRP83_08150 [Planctomycetota bacterium]|nr:MAG: hypothetical protein DRP83_08150 [Planctomycetota bacterium]